MLQSASSPCHLQSVVQDLGFSGKENLQRLTGNTAAAVLTSRYILSFSARASTPLLVLLGCCSKLFGDFPSLKTSFPLFPRGASEPSELFSSFKPSTAARTRIPKSSLSPAVRTLTIYNASLFQREQVRTAIHVAHDWTAQAINRFTFYWLCLSCKLRALCTPAEIRHFRRTRVDVQSGVAGAESRLPQDQYTRECLRPARMGTS